MIIKDVELETVCGITSILPENSSTEVAFAGKSNVGKSSLINAILNRKALARTSAQPGKTQTINFYKMTYRMEDDVTEETKPQWKDMYCVDLPGYGFAKVSKETQEKWGNMIESYLNKSRVLKAVFLLVDIRHEPSANDKNMYKWIVHNGYDPIIIATKLDKITRNQVPKHVKMIRTGLDVKKGTTIIPFSATTKQGRDEIWKLLDELNCQ
ncbi:MAG: YihA family ribosome biogenesis GTP-binding protein [Lachnospiraceae bacterium]|nr:YihA family ribosome biogenesis GTP-binding protein [Lachnospiraceae bacterium]